MRCVIVGLVPDYSKAPPGSKASWALNSLSTMKNLIIKIPGLGRVGIAYERGGEATRFPGGLTWQTNLALKHFRCGFVIDERDLGSGLTTNVGSLALANDFAWSAVNALNSLFAKMKYHASGTGATAAAATDIKLQTPSTQGGQTPVAGTQVLVSAANLQKYQSVATIAYTGVESVTEWGIFSYGSTLPAVTALTDATGSPFTAGSATSGTVTATPLTASSSTVMGQQMSIFDNTNATRISWGLVTSNTNAVITVPAWYKTADGTAGTAPVNADTYVIRPIMFDHRVFTSVGVASGDSIQFTWTLTIASGG
jgi:hypothetical protein